MTRIAYLDCFSGISGDMLLGALIDAGWPLDHLQAAVDALQLGDVTVSAERVHKRHLAGTQVRVHAPDAQPLRHPADLTDIIARADLPEDVRRRSQRAIDLLAEAEARVHGMPVEQVHFHEVGAVDTLVDVVGAAAGFHALGVAQIVSSPLPWSHGSIHIAHGHFPVPAPAVAALVEGIPVVPLAIEGETVTPTGAALVRALAAEVGPIPAMTVTRVAHGAGVKDWPDRPNLLRLVLGEAATGHATAETLTILACNLDDMNPEWYGPLIEAALGAGALDIWLTPVHMKKNRPGVVAEILCHPTDALALRTLLFTQTTTLGIREQQVTRWALPRQSETVRTPFGEVRVKIAAVDGERTKFAPEHDDCAAHAAANGVSVRDVWLAAIQAAERIERRD